MIYSNLLVVNPEHKTKQERSMIETPVFQSYVHNTRSEIKFCQEKLVGGNIFNGVS
jgi:hypothetical protein